MPHNRKVEYEITEELLDALDSAEWSPTTERLIRLHEALNKAKTYVYNPPFPKPNWETVEDWKRRIAAGEQRQSVARGSGFSTRTVGRYTQDVEKPYEHRGRKKKHLPAQ